MNFPVSRAAESSGPVERRWYPALSGWLLSELVALEEHASGILLTATRAGPAWRNAVALAAASGVLERPDDFLLRACAEDHGSRPWPEVVAILCSLLTEMKPADIVTATLGECPDGLLGALKKIGPDPLTTPGAYLRLHALFASDLPEHRARRRVIEQLVSLNDDLLQVCECLDLALLTPEVARNTRTAIEAHRLNELAATIRRVCSTATDEALRQSIEQSGRFHISNWARGWISRADRLPTSPLPTDDDPDLLRVTPASAAEVGREFRNCLATKASRLALGLWAAVAWRERGLIVSLTKLQDGDWLVTGIHAHGNGDVTRDMVEAVQAKFTRPGIHCFLPARPSREMAAASTLFHWREGWDFDLDELEVD